MFTHYYYSLLIIMIFRLHQFAYPLLGLLLGLFLIPFIGFATVNCPPAGTESPHHPGCCYGGQSLGGMCVVSACPDSACPSNQELYGRVQLDNTEIVPGYIEGELQ